jgi:RHS repeat-associated protein
VNDLDVDSGTLTYSVVAGPTNGTLLAFHSTGTFTYRPNVAFVGVDTVTYKVSDGTNDSNTATIAIGVGTKLLARQNLDPFYRSPFGPSNAGHSMDLFSRQDGTADGAGRSNIPLASSQETDGSLAASGGLQLLEILNPDQSLIYRSNTLTKPIIAVDTQLASGVAVPTAISAQLTFNGVAGTSYAYSTSGLVAGQAMRFAIQADGSSLATGMYGYSLAVTLTISGVNHTQTFVGKQSIVNRSTSVYGSGWWLDGLDSVVDSTAGALLVKGNGDSLWFPKSGSNYLHAAGDVQYHSFVKNGTGTFTVTSKTGTVSNFSNLGLLTSVVDPNGNTTTLAYADRNSDGIANELISVTDPFGRVTQINYTSNQVSSIAHFSGRTTTLSYSSGNLTGYTLTDPDGAGPLAAPAVAFAYTSGQLTSRTNPLSQTTSFAFGSNDGRLRTVTYPDAKTWQLVPAETIGLPTGTSGNTLKRPIDAQATVMDQRSNVWKFRTDRFGGITESITPLGYVRTAVRDADGNPYIVNEPDPDGTGPLSSSVMYLGYNTQSDLTHLIAPDGGVTTLTYSSTLHRLLSVTDPVGRTTSSTYDAFGNQMTSVDGAGFTTTYAVNSRGLPTSITPPDPDGAGPLTSPVTGLAYDSYGRLITLTNPDSSTQTFTYNSADQMLTSVDELTKTTTFVFDSLGRMTSITDRVAAVTQFAYDSLSRVIKQTDALGNVTDIEYNNRGWVSKIKYPDADGAGPLTRAEDNRSYDGVGNMTSQGDPLGNYQGATPYTFNADNLLISRGSAGNPGLFENWDYDNAGRLKNAYRASSGGYPDRTWYTYDAANRIISKSVQSHPSIGTQTVYYSESYTFNQAGELISAIDGRGNATQYTYNARGLLASETLPDADGSGAQFRWVITHAYDNMGRETSIDRGFGRVTTLEYNNRSWVNKINKPDPDGAGALSPPVILIGYNLRGDQTSVTDPLNRVTSYTFDNEQRVTKRTDPDPDGAGPLTSAESHWAYNAMGWLTSTTDARGGVTSVTFDNLGRMLTQTDPDPDGAGGLSAPVTTLAYNMQGLVTVTDAMARVTTYARDNKGRVSGVTDPAGNTTNYAYDFYGNLLTQTDPDPDGAGPLARPVTTYVFDSVDRTTSKTDAKNGVTTYTYDVASNLTSLKDPVNNTTNFGYDGLNRLVLDTNALSKSKSYVYDVAGNFTRSVDRNGRMIQYVYDTLDRQTEEKWQQSGSATPSLTVATTQEGGPINEVQSVGWTTSAYSMTGTFTLTHNGQTTSAIAWNADAATIKAALEALSTVGAGNVAVTVTIPGGNAYSRTFGLTFQNGKGATNVPQTTITTSSLNGIPFGAPTGFANTTVTGGTYTESQTITLSNASGGTWRVAYNGEVSAALAPTITAAQLKSMLDGFNGIDNVTVTGSSGSFTVTFGGTQSTTNMQQIFGDAANASNGSTLRTITTAYNAASQITSVSDPSSTINFTLDNLGRATTIAQSVNGLTPTVSLTQSFDAMNNRTELKATIGSTLDFKNTYQFDKLQRLTDIVQQGQSGGNTVIAKHITQSFNALSQRTQIARYQSTGTSNSVATTDFTFDTANRLSGIAHKQGATNLNTYAYTYDPLSRIATIVSTLEGTDTYSYDQTSQLVGATHTSHANETYGFDANGNRNTSGFTTGTNNQTTAGLGFTYTYDDEGNRITKTETSTGKVEEYTWDHRNRLTKVVFRNSSGGAIVKQVDYEYDAYNRLVRRTFDADGAGAGAATNQYWVYDEGINAVLQFDGSSASNLSHRYLWSDNVDELLADEQIAGNNTLWGLADHLGSLRDIADYSESTGVTTIANHRTLNSFGKLVSETNAAVDMLFAFTGKQFDEATGLQHNLFRWYDPVLGQWLSEDPIGFAAGDENVRRYVGNGVVDSVDPTGLVNQAQYGWWHFADAFCDYITPWNGTPGSDMERGVSYVGTGFLVVGTTAAVGAGAVIVSGTGGTIVYGTQATAKVLTAAEMQALQTATYIRRLQYLKWLKEGGKGIPPNTGF